MAAPGVQPASAGLSAARGQAVLQFGQWTLFSQHGAQTINPHFGHLPVPESDNFRLQAIHAFSAARSALIVIQMKTPTAIPARTAMASRIKMIGMIRLRSDRKFHYRADTGRIETECLPHRSPRAQAGRFDGTFSLLAASRIGIVQKRALVSLRSVTGRAPATCAPERIPAAIGLHSAVFLREKATNPIGRKL